MNAKTIGLLGLEKFNDPEYWFSRAEEVRVLSQLMIHEEARAIMVRIAQDYENLGDQARQRRLTKPKEQLR